MVDSAKTPENGKTKSPTAVAQTAAGDYQRDATIVSEMTAAGVLSIVAGRSLQNAVRAPGYKVYRDQVLKAGGNPSDPLEAMLLEQAMVAHHRLMGLHAEAARAESPEMIEVLKFGRDKTDGRISAAVPGREGVSCADLSEKRHGRQTAKRRRRRSKNCAA